MSDVYCFGHVSTGVILRLKGRMPEPDGYGEIAETLENHAGEAAGSALVLAQLGNRVAIEGNWIGDTPECRRTLEFLQSRGIDCGGLVVKTGYRGVTEVVVSDGHTRTVFGRYCDLLFTTRQWEMPDEKRIRAARFVCVDPSFGEATLAVARTARAAGLPLASCDAKPESELTACCDLMVISGEFLRREFPAAVERGAAREALFERYQAACGGLVIFTSGSEALWFARRGQGRREQAPFQVEVVDSAGAGDSFRGAMIHGLLRGWPDDVCVQYACAVAALICTTAPGCVHPPSAETVMNFLRERGIKLPI
ncbi:MAG: carbohydrate kinase family protein [Nibricoccus sp.]